MDTFVIAVTARTEVPYEAEAIIMTPRGMIERRGFNTSWSRKVQEAGSVHAWAELLIRQMFPARKVHGGRIVYSLPSANLKAETWVVEVETDSFVNNDPKE